MQISAKILTIPLLVVIACLFAGFYGILHDQVSYTVSPDYFQHLKFEQFRINTGLHPRVGAAQVGWAATWWMGLLVGPLLVLLSLLSPGFGHYVGTAVRGFCVAIGVAAICGLLGLIIALVLPMEGILAGYTPPEGVQDREAFMEIGTMHNASYLGGLIGLVIAGVYVVMRSVRLRKQLQSARLQSRDAHPPTPNPGH